MGGNWTPLTLATIVVGLVALVLLVCVVFLYT